MADRKPHDRPGGFEGKSGANLARIRDNQRRSRARRKEYLQELEEKHRQCEQMGIEASAEIQAAARKVLEENRKLRTLLRQRGVSDAEMDMILAQTESDPATTTSSPMPPDSGSGPASATLATRLATKRRCQPILSTPSRRSSSQDSAPQSMAQTPATVGIGSARSLQVPQSLQGSQPSGRSPARLAVATTGLPTIQTSTFDQSAVHTHSDSSVYSPLTPRPSTDSSISGTIGIPGRTPYGVQYVQRPDFPPESAHHYTPMANQYPPPQYPMAFPVPPQLPQLQVPQSRNDYYQPDPANNAYRPPSVPLRSQQPPPMTSVSMSTTISIPANPIVTVAQGYPQDSTSCLYAAGVIRNMRPGAHMGPEVESALGCPTTADDCHVPNNVVFDVMDRYSGGGGLH